MRERAEGRDDNGTDSPRWQARREAGSRTGRDDAGKEFSPTCLLANLLTILTMLFHAHSVPFSSYPRPVGRYERRGGFSHPLSSRSSGSYSIMLRAVFASSFFPASRRSIPSLVSSGVCNVIFCYLTFHMLNTKKTMLHRKPTASPRRRGNTNTGNRKRRSPANG